MTMESFLADKAIAMVCFVCSAFLFYISAIASNINSLAAMMFLIISVVSFIGSIWYVRKT